MTRDERRHHASRVKAKAAAVLARQHRAQPDAKQIGRAAAMHNTCPCWMCTTHDPERRRQWLRDFNKLEQT